MMIRTKLLASHAVMAVAVTLIAIVIVAILRIVEANQRELQTSYEQIRAINLIAAWANDYSEQVAELYILGTDPGEIEEAREGLLGALERKERLVTEELDYLEDPEELARENVELERIDAMRKTLLGLERVRKGLVPLLAGDGRVEAEVVYRDQIEHRLDSVLGALIEAATENEREEVDVAIANSSRLTDRVRLLALSLVAVMALLVLANALMVHRTLSRPIAALAAGADAVGRGELSHVIALRQNDELGNLAERFNLMTGQIRDQRDRLLRAKLDLERQVDERTEELRARGEELEDAVERLRQVDASRARFLADISHELRTPLTILRGQAEVTLRAPENGPDRLRQTLAQVVRKANQMSRLVEDLLFLARSEAGAISVERDPLVLQDVLADVLLDSQGLSRRDGVTISPRQPSEPIVLLGDAGRLRQAILIPLDNAIRLAPAESTVRLELETDGEAATILVSDEGPGFTPEEAERAFVRFSRGTANRGRTGRGTGLGLSIARWIVDQHGGTVSVDSRPGEGATVRIDLPLAGAAA